LLPDEGTTMPGLGTRDICTLGRDGLRVDLASVFVSVGRFGYGDRGQNEAGPEGLR
jgi:hypothetical protein